MGTGFTIPNFANAILVPGPDRAPQAQPDSLDFRIIAAAEALSGVLEGCQVTPSGPVAMTAEVDAGTVEVAGVAVAVLAQTVMFDPADADPRFDLVTVDNTGTASVVKGIANADPAFPDLDPKTDIVLAAVFIEAGTVTITAARIVDKRMLRGLLSTVDLSPTAGIQYGQLDLTGSIQIGDLAFDPATQVELNAVALALSTHEALTTLAHGGIVADTDPRLSDARTPAGAAGGVLSGTYPDPGFAVDMATQAELNALAAMAVLDGDAAGGVLAGTYPSPSFAVDMATQVELDAHAALTTAAHGGIVASNDPRLSDARPPTGAAGGVLSGSYPAPGFAVDMATQAELDSEASTRGAADSALAAPQYVTLAASATLANERVLVAGSGLGLTDGGAGGNATLAVNVDGSTLEINADALRVKDGGITIAKLAFDPATQAELDAEASARAAADTLLAAPQYVVLAATATLANERVLTGTANQVILTDGDAGGNIVLSLPQSINAGASPTFAALTLTGMTAGSVLFAGVAGAVSQDNAHLFWNDATNRLAIGDNTPDAALDVTPAGGDDGVYSRVSTTFNLISGGAPFYTVPVGTVGIDVDQYGNLWGGTNTLVANRNPSSWNQQIPDFLWSANSLRLYTRSLVITEMGDPPDITRARAGPNNSYPYNNGNGITGINTGVTIAIDRWRPWIVPFGGTPDVTVGGSLQADSATMAVQTAEIPRDATGNGDYATGGKFFLAVTRLTRGVASNAIAVLNTGDVLLGEDAITAGTDAAKLTVQLDGNLVETQTLTASGSVTGGTYTLTFYPDFAGSAGQTTSALNYNDNAATIQTALRALAGIGSPNVVVSGGPLPGTPITVTFAGTLANTNLPRLKVNSSLTGGGTYAQATTADGRAAQTVDVLQLLNASAACVFLCSSAGRVGINMGTGTPAANLQLGVSPTTATGGISFGTDVTLYRSAADVLKTDDTLHVVTALGVTAAPTSLYSIDHVRAATDLASGAYGMRIDRTFTITGSGSNIYGAMDIYSRTGVDAFNQNYIQGAQFAVKLNKTGGIVSNVQAVSGTIVTGTGNASASNVDCLNFETDWFSVGSATTMRGVQVLLVLKASGTANDGSITNAYGVRVQISNSASGASNTAAQGQIGTLIAFYAVAPNVGSASNTVAITTAHGMLIENFGSTKVTTSYGLRMSAQANSTTTWALAIEGGNSYHVGNLFIGTTATVATARLHIAAGAAGASSAPIKVNSGTVQTTPEVGTIEYNNNWYATKNGAVRFALGGALFDHAVDAGNGTTVETDLYSDSIAATTLGTNNCKLQAQYGGVFVSSGTATRQLRVYFGGTVIFDSGALTLSTSSAWNVEALIIRVSATVVRYTVSMTTQGAALAAYTATGEVTGLTLSNANTLKITGQAAGVGAATNDIVAKLGFVEYLGPAA